MTVIRNRPYHISTTSIVPYLFVWNSRIYLSCLFMCGWYIVLYLLWSIKRTIFLVFERSYIWFDCYNALIYLNSSWSFRVLSICVNDILGAYSFQSTLNYHSIKWISANCNRNWNRMLKTNIIRMIITEHDNRAAYFLFQFFSHTKLLKAPWSPLKVLLPIQKPRRYVDLTIV